MMRAGLSQAELARKVGCTRFAINLLIHNKRNASWTLAKKISSVVTDNPDEGEGLAFFLSGYHKEMRTILERCPDAFKDFRPTWDGKNHSGFTVR
jgi:DNA-binding XRE family transcriptional regulator